MKTAYQHRRASKNGVALVIVLGLLSVLTTLAVAFAIAMRVENMAAQNFANSVRAEHLVQAGIARAMEAVQISMKNPLSKTVTYLTYPRWYNKAGERVEAMVSTNGIACKDLLSSEVYDAIPGFIMNYNSADKVVSDECKWLNIEDKVSGKTNRVAFAVFNNSGLLDANSIGGTNRVWSESLREIDIHKVPGISSTNQFFTNRTADVRYETVPELLKLQSTTAPPGLDAAYTQDLFVYSYDPGRDEGFTNNWAKTNKLGIATTNDLKLKFYINAISGMDPKTYLSNPDFKVYTNKLVQILVEAGLKDKPEDVLWNIVNWIDDDRYPQNGYDGTSYSTSPRPSYLSTEGGEALPLINEVALVKEAAGTNCHFEVELWYPFVVENEDWGAGSSSYKLVIDTIPASASTTNLIKPMLYGDTNSEFMVYKSNVMPLSPAPQIRVIVLNQDNRPVDASMDRNTPSGGTYWPIDDWTNFVKYTTFSNYESWEVDDPRSNCKGGIYWKKHPTGNTLGRMNSISYPWGEKAGWPNTYDRQGLPIYVKNGPMENVGEMGYIPLSNRENHPDMDTKPWKWYWCTIDLLTRDQGAHLLDFVTVFPSNRSGHGFVTVNTRDEETLKALFTEMKIGWKNTTNDYFRPMHVETDPDVEKLINAVVEKIRERTEDQPQGAISFSDLFEGADYTEAGTPMPGGRVAQAFRNFGPWWAKNPVWSGKVKENDKVREDAFRNIIELITFRQNIFTIITAAQIMAPNGTTVEAEKRGLATIYRDSYTGNYFVRSFKWVK